MKTNINYLKYITNFNLNTEKLNYEIKNNA